MKKCILLSVLISVVAATPAFSRKANNDDLLNKKNAPLIKTGWNIGVLPAINYNNDLGFQMGGLGQIYYYGDGSIYPNYFHKIEAHAYVFSKGAKQFILKYDSKHLLQGKRVTADVQYMDNPLCGFYGFNGAASPYHADLNLNKSSDKNEGIAFYADYQKLFKANLDIQGSIADKFTWIGGVSYSFQKYTDITIKPYIGEETLFHQYKTNGLIPEEDTYGHRIELKGGIVFDSRDFEPNPTRGAYGTVTLTGGESISATSKGSVVLSADFRQYIPIMPSKITLAYQLAYKGKIAGSLPFYALPAFSMRGSYGSRIVGNGVAWASVDLRITAARFTLFRQNFELGLVGFADCGAAVQTHKFSEQSKLYSETISKTIEGVNHGPYLSIFDGGISPKERLHASAGGGFFYSMNKNFITAVEFGRPLNPQDGTMGIYVNLGFSF